MYFANLSNFFWEVFLVLLSSSRRIFSFFALRKTHVVFGPPSFFSLLAVTLKNKVCIFKTPSVAKFTHLKACFYTQLKGPHTPDAARQRGAISRNSQENACTDQTRVFLRQTEIGRNKHGGCWGLRRRIVVTFTVPPAFASKTDCVDSSNLETKATTWGISSSRTGTSARWTAVFRVLQNDTRNIWKLVAYRWSSYS
jgi:hypothetical protein